MGDNNNNCAGNEGCLARTRNRFHNLAYYLGINPRTARNQRKHNKELEREAKFTTPEATAARARAWEAQRLQAEQNARARDAAARANRNRRNAERAEAGELQRQRPGYDATIEYVLRLPYLYPFRNNQQYLVAARYIQDKFLNRNAAPPRNIEIATLAGLTNDIYQHLRQVPQSGTMNYLEGSRRAINRIHEIHTELEGLARQQADQAVQAAQAAQRVEWAAAQAEEARAAAARAARDKQAQNAASAAAMLAPPSGAQSRRRGHSPPRRGGSKKNTRKAKKTRKIRR
uniref:Uncharacterized protein n=1 Tax=viral metagenome TaxID=1070528 RepID=A0A6C0BB05_9ZZZZ